MWGTYKDAPLDQIPVVEAGSSFCFMATPVLTMIYLSRSKVFTKDPLPTDSFNISLLR